MTETAQMNRDARGVLRGACTCGDCDVYMSPTDGLKCAYCDCVPAKHANLTKDINASRLVSETTVHSDKVQERKKEDVPFIKKEDVPFIKKEDVPFIKKEDVPFIKKEDVPFIKKEDVQKELHVPHAASDPSQTSTGQIDNQPAKTIAFNVPEVGSSSDVHLQEQVSSAHRPKSSDVRKRQKQQTHQKQDKISTEQIEMKPCKLLHLAHMPCTEIPPSRGEAKVKGVFKIAYKWETIYVGASRDCVFKQLRGQFSGNGKQDLFNFLNDLDIKELENVSVFWLDDSKHTHSCGKKSYPECIGKLQGQKPRFNSRSAPEMPKAEAPNNDTSSSTSMP